ncbi:MAG: hypothetical protein V1816_10835 [Pseudomonadota bacterium]
MEEKQSPLERDPARGDQKTDGDPAGESLGDLIRQGQGPVLREIDREINRLR